MKKLLLFSCMFFAFVVQAQDKWTEYPTGQPAASTGINSMSIVDANVTWLSMACGTTGCTTIRRYSKTTDGGLTWSTGVIDLGASSTSLQVSNIHGVSADVAYVSVSPRAGESAIGGVWKTSNGGSTWERQTTASFNDGASFANVVYFWNENEGMCMGDPVGGYFEIYTTTNGGTNWTRVPSSPAIVPVNDLDYGLTDQFTVTGNTIWAGTTTGRILKSSNRGVTWSVSQSPIPDFGGGLAGDESGCLAFTSETNGILTTSDWQLFQTTDGGATWGPSLVWEGILRNFDVAAIPGLPNTYVSTGEDLDSGVTRGTSYSVDGGQTWVDINDNPDENYVDGSKIKFLSPTVGFAGGFTTSAAVGGVFKWNGVPLLAAKAFSNDNAFVASPNPTTGNLDLTGKDISNVVVFDVLGKQVINSNYTSLSKVSLNLTGFNSGIYMVKVTNTAGAVSTIKVVKQ